MTNKLFLLKNSKGFIPQRKKESEGLNLEIIKDALKESGFDVYDMTFYEFINGEYPINGSYFFYASSQYPIYKEYIQDILVYIENSGGILLPNYNLFLAHENKSFQELEYCDNV